VEFYLNMQEGTPLEDVFPHEIGFSGPISVKTFIGKVAWAYMRGRY
jgi:hypothetical protein